MDMHQIEKLTQTYSDERRALADLVRAFHAEVERAKDRYLPGIQTCVTRTADAEGALRGALELAPELFAKPRTRTFHGVKVGYQKAKDGLEWDDAALVVARIERARPADAELLVKVVKAPIKKALEQLADAELAALGVRRVPGEDEIVVKPQDAEVDKLVAALLADVEDHANDGPREAA